MSSSVALSRVFCCCGETFVECARGDGDGDGGALNEVPPDCPFCGPVINGSSAGVSLCVSLKGLGCNDLSEEETGGQSECARAIACVSGNGGSDAVFRTVWSFFVLADVLSLCMASRRSVVLTERTKEALGGVLQRSPKAQVRRVTHILFRPIDRQTASEEQKKVGEENADPPSSSSVIPKKPSRVVAVNRVWSMGEENENDFRIDPQQLWKDVRGQELKNHPLASRLIPSDENILWVYDQIRREEEGQGGADLASMYFVLSLLNPQFLTFPIHPARPVPFPDTELPKLQSDFSVMTRQMDAAVQPRANFFSVYLTLPQLLVRSRNTQGVRVLIRTLRTLHGKSSKEVDLAFHSETPSTRCPVDLVLTSEDVETMRVMLKEGVCVWGPAEGLQQFWGSQGELMYGIGREGSREMLVLLAEWVEEKYREKGRQKEMREDQGEKGGGQEARAGEEGTDNKEEGNSKAQLITRAEQRGQAFLEPLCEFRAVGLTSVFGEGRRFSLFQLACKSADAKRISVLLERMSEDVRTEALSSVFDPDGLKLSVLHLCTSSGFNTEADSATEAFQFLVDAGACAEARDSKGRSVVRFVLDTAGPSSFGVPLKKLLELGCADEERDAELSSRHVDIFRHFFERDGAPLPQSVRTLSGGSVPVLFVVGGLKVPDKAGGGTKIVRAANLLIERGADPCVSTEEIGPWLFWFVDLIFSEFRWDVDCRPVLESVSESPLFDPNRECFVGRSYGSQVSGACVSPPLPSGGEVQEGGTDAAGGGSETCARKMTLTQIAIGRWAMYGSRWRHVVEILLNKGGVAYPENPFPSHSLLNGDCLKAEVISEFLIKRGTDPFVKDEKGCNALLRVFKEIGRVVGWKADEHIDSILCIHSAKLLLVCSVLSRSSNVRQQLSLRLAEVSSKSIADSELPGGASAQYALKNVFIFGRVSTFLTVVESLLESGARLSRGAAERVREACKAAQTEGSDRLSLENAERKSEVISKLRVLMEARENGPDEELLGREREGLGEGESEGGRERGAAAAVGRGESWGSDATAQASSVHLEESEDELEKADALLSSALSASFEQR
uniref:Uncharacterized protein n=1 Tax=Chromera velia CCMP2878 TaxID=1169474 RepID=A0A0G4I275_9ALVE|eukprot:Cvel_1710.t1-p1 / transcript=Cvel_1710.t1 / gene=Cvel_1710 / organism=Chromera_velia_CCMP2878 / gene_product=hypothetical protein / transcript_product=hypothetical protein / location=Cvel_scaffold61:142258-146178(-) / protein_length=1071 / sequence_SO=supercontig / SO=protein_coding / is_pseudo=false